MSTVFQLFGQEKIEEPSDPETIVTIAVTDILASHAELACIIKEISKHLDALDYITDALGDSDIQARFRQEAKRSRESLMLCSICRNKSETCRSATKYPAREVLGRGQVTLSRIAEHECSAS